MSDNYLDQKVILLQGNWHQRSFVIDKIRQSIEAEWTVIDSTCSYAFLEQSLQQESCFAQRRVVLVNGVPKFDFTRATFVNKITKLLDDVPSDCLLVLNNISISAKKFLDKVKKLGKVITYPEEATLSEASKLISKWLSSAQIKIKENLLNEFLKNTFTDRDKISVDELYINFKKLLCIGGKEDIKEEEVLYVAQHDRNFLVWNLIDILDKQDIQSALSLISSMSAQVNNVESEVVQVLHVLMWKYKLLLYIMECEGNINEIKSKVGQLKKIERKGSKYNIHFLLPDPEKTVYSSNMVQYTAKSYSFSNSIFKKISLEQLYSINNMIRSVLSTIRSTKIEGFALVYLELICMYICGTLKDEKTLNALVENEYSFE